MKRLVVPSLLMLILMAASPLYVSAAVSAAPPSSPAIMADQVSTIPYVASTYTVSGMAYDADGHPVPGAKVTLYDTSPIDDTKATSQTNTRSSNPQLSGDGANSTMGYFEFIGIQSGVYMLTVEKGGISVPTIIWVKDGNVAENVTIAGYIENGVSTSARPTWTPQGPTYQSTPGASGTQQDIGSVFLGILKVLLMCIVGLQLIASIAILTLRVGRR